MSRNQTARVNPFASQAPTDAAQRIVDLELQLAEVTTDSDRLRAELEKSWRSHLVELADGVRQVVRAKSPADACTRAGAGSKFRGYV